MSRRPSGRPGEPPIRFRTTASQWLAVALVCLLGIPALMYAVYVLVGHLVGDSPVRELVRFIAALYAVFMGARLAARLIARGGKGIDVDEVGIRPAARRATRLAAWPAITDIRVRRSPLRRRVVVYTDRGGRWWLPVPYSGLLLARDPRFAEKVATLREMWDTYRYGPADPVRPGGGAGEGAGDDEAAAPQGTTPRETASLGTVPQGTAPQGAVPQRAVPQGTVSHGTADPYPPPGAPVTERGGTTAEHPAVVPPPATDIPAAAPDPRPYAPDGPGGPDERPVRRRAPGRHRRDRGG